MSDELWRRRCSILLLDDSDDALDVSELHVTFNIKQGDYEAPDNATIRIFNLSADTINKVQKRYNRIVVQAGYMNGPFGVLFTGAIIQYRKGRIDQKTTYLDILAADNPVAYHFALVGASLAAGSTPEQRRKVVIEAFGKKGVKPGEMVLEGFGGVLPRGRVLFGLARGLAHILAADRGLSWNILKGRLNIIPLDGYLQTQAVELTSTTGLIGRAEQTEDGVNARCLINANIQVGGRVRINNASINTTEAAKVQAAITPKGGGQLKFDSYTSMPQYFADIAADGLYRVFVADHTGDTRGQDWYTDLTMLKIDPVTRKVNRKGM